MAAMNNRQKKEWAELLVTRTDMNQREIAEKVGVMPKTISRWWSDHEWEQLRTSFFITRKRELQRVYIQISRLNTAISERDEPWATNKEADTIVKLAASAKSLEADLDLSTIIDVFMGFNEWVRTIDFEQSKNLTDLMDSYIKERAGK